MRLTAPALTLLASALLLAACKPTTPAAAPADDAAEAAPTTSTTQAPAATDPSDNLNAVLWIQRSEEYRANSLSIFRAAADHLDDALAEKNWDALVPEERELIGDATALPPAVIMDIDETVLDNSPYQARLIQNGLEYDEVTWAQWVAEKKAKPVPGVLEFAKAAEAKGVTILYLSNRAQHLQEATLANLRAEGLPVKDESVFLGLGTFVENCEQNGTEKTCRRRLAGRDYRVLMQFGDQLGDFVDILANTSEARGELLDTYGDWFGERWWMLANPSYGGWEPAQFNNAWDQPAGVRRESKRNALELSN
ncbi:5'-nucleotidase, lipoprotein e(P4) family [Luteimonas fraxinea]|uniref:5'-nucleotidase, lipoprotein e(P4) family n=1 Tax=Luteimonas fraxinea TaxID=2901869 RepID=A0ABS8UK91_9GAMM|nr:5'-nucleotidase, lipoprotein e(P4) family [Luteimonas fraxinea]MCD9098920.1 5'-nucleotidase, lipoprotein e(P4) family [Luteimonas fraxinea]MCD9127627.1 5'-nucleotidase, lipoprotein e(P4) family [Luteimonas fraxinea]UHH08685.1 5'-nucleotidase, lipoprotein e(P4) family [Luteimonas fraxinea]